MELERGAGSQKESENKTIDVVYNQEKDFYRGIGGELRFKAEGLFKKAKEKGISIEEINITTLRENRVDFPGIGMVELPAYLITVKGRDIRSQQVIVDGKHIDYYNRYQRYIAEKVSEKNLVKDDKGRVLRENNKPMIKQPAELLLNDWDRFEIGKNLVDDKEFGIEKTITGACDRVIRKLMGENDWLYPDEARLLDEEFNMVQNAIEKEDARRKGPQVPIKKATDRQINYLKAKIRNAGFDADDEKVMKEVLNQSGFEGVDITELSTGSMSRIIDNIGDILPRVKAALEGQDPFEGQGVH